MLLSEQIRSMGPGNSVYYRLMLPSSDGTDRTFPADSFFKIGESPYGVPNSPYSICFYDEEYRLIPFTAQTIHINVQSQARPPEQLNLHLLNAQGTPSKSGLHTATAPTLPALPQPKLPEEVDLEFRRHLQAMDLEERQQEFIKNSTYVTEVAELFTVNRLMRREMLELHRIIVQHSSRAYQDIDHVKSTVHELLALQKAVLEHAATQIAKPPAPPPDYVGLGHSALAMIKEIGVALVQRAHAKETGSKLPETASLPQLSPPAAEVSKAPTAVPADAITKMVEKLQGVTDIDVAMAMCSPESWKSMLDQLRSTPPPDAAKSADKPVASAE